MLNYQYGAVNTSTNCVMRPKRMAAIGLLLVLAFALGRRADGAGSSVRGELRHQTLELRTVPDNTGYVAVNLSFDLHIANGSRGLIRLPAAGDGSPGAERLTILGVETQATDGKWKWLYEGTFVDNGSLRYEPCTELRSGGEGDIGNVKTEFYLLKKHLVPLGEEPTVRLYFMVSCRQPRGGVSSQAVATDAFRMPLPSLEGPK